jgi:hypothetical protein
VPARLKVTGSLNIDFNSAMKETDQLLLVLLCSQLPLAYVLASNVREEDFEMCILEIDKHSAIATVLCWISFKLYSSVM